MRRFRLFFTCFLGFFLIASLLPAMQLPTAFAETAAIRQEINILDTSYGSGTGRGSATSSEQVQLDTTQYGGTASSTQYFFEVVWSMTSGNATATLARVSNGTVDATISLTPSATATIQRVGFSPPAATTTVYEVNVTGGTGTSVTAARIVAIQRGNPISKTETQIEIGDNETGRTNTTTSTGALNSPKYWYYDSSKWSPAPTGFVEVTYAKAADQTSFTSSTFTTVGNATWTVPTNISPATATIELWGGGGAGGGAKGSGNAGGGGCGGVYAIKNSTSVTPGAQYPLRVGATTVGSANAAGPQGASSSFNDVVAVGIGGKGGNANNGVACVATSTGSVGDSFILGGVGATGASARGGGGGGGAGSGGVGGTAATSTGASGGVGGGFETLPFGVGGGGGTGSTGSNTSGTIGTAPGGGGGGARATSNTNVPGGTGAAGKVVISYTIATTSLVTIVLQHATSALSTAASWSDDTIITSTGTATAATRVRAPFVPTNGYYYRIVTDTSNAAFIYDIYSAKIIIDQSNSRIDKFEPQYLLLNTLAANTSSNQGALTTWNSQEWAGVNNAYVHQVDASSSASSTVNLLNATASTTLNTITGATTTVQSGFSGLPVSGALTLDISIPQNAATTYADRILVDVTFSGPTTSHGLQVHGGGSGGKLILRGGSATNGGGGKIKFRGGGL